MAEEHKIREHFKRHKVVYSCLATGIGVAGITWFIMRDVDLQRISRGIAVTANRGIAVEGKNVVMNNVSYISSERQGPPSWVIRCLETGGIWPSQRSTAMDMGLPENELSRHLNGLRDNVRGYHFERVCMAA